MTVCGGPIGHYGPRAFTDGSNRAAGNRAFPNGSFHSLEEIFVGPLGFVASRKQYTGFSLRVGLSGQSRRSVAHGMNGLDNAPYRVSADVNKL